MWRSAIIVDFLQENYSNLKTTVRAQVKINDKLHPNTEAMNEDDRLTKHTHGTH